MRDVAGLPPRPVRDEPLHILIADDDTASLLLLKSLLTREGYRVTAVADGRQAVDAFVHTRPDLVLLDVTMPEMNGYEAARAVKGLAGDRFVPLIFLTAISDEEGLARCIEAGGDDFLTKPYSRVILRAKIASLLRTRSLYDTVREQRDVLADFQQQIRQEQELARNIMASIVQRWPARLDGVRHLLRPTSLFNGDFLLIAEGPSHQLNVMLGDLTGHGLSAAVGSVPAAEVFYGMCAEGYSLKDIAQRLNERLCQLLPAQLFCAAALIRLDRERGTVSVWNGGLPEVVVVGDGAVRQRCRSRHLPLGIVAQADEAVVLDIFELRPGERVFLFSDGLTELEDERGCMLESDGVEALLRAAPAQDAFDRILAEVERRVAVHGQRDDVTVLELRADDRPVENERQHAVLCPATGQGEQWRMRLELGAELLRSADPLPLLLGALDQVECAAEQRSTLFAVLSELFNNALEHGLLGLDSGMKRDADGFARYYEERERRLRRLSRGQISIDCRLWLVGDGGQLRVEVEDDGPGFDYEKALAAAPADADEASGRGLALVTALCDTFGYERGGRRAVALYCWQRGAP